MTFIADLAPYDYYPSEEDALAIGWLDADEPFTSGLCPQDVRDMLAEMARKPERLMRGYHFCQFCRPPPAVPPGSIRSDLDDVPHGNGEVWVRTASGRNYAAPVLVVHYIDEHTYLPPEAFIRAIRERG